MANIKTEPLPRPGIVSVRKGNRKATISFLAQGNRFFFAFSTALVLMLCALVFVWTNHQFVSLGYQIGALQKERSDLMELNRKYKLELANLTSLDRLETLAKKELGLIIPAPRQIQVIE